MQTLVAPLAATEECARPDQATCGEVADHQMCMGRLVGEGGANPSARSRRSELVERAHARGLVVHPYTFRNEVGAHLSYVSYGTKIAPSRSWSITFGSRMNGMAVKAAEPYRCCFISFPGREQLQVWVLKTLERATWDQRMGFLPWRCALSPISHAYWQVTVDLSSTSQITTAYTSANVGFYACPGAFHGHRFG